MLKSEIFEGDLRLSLWPSPRKVPWLCPPGTGRARWHLSTGAAWGPCAQGLEPCHGEGDAAVPAGGSGLARRAGASVVGGAAGRLLLGAGSTGCCRHGEGDEAEVRREGGQCFRPGYPDGGAGDFCVEQKSTCWALAQLAASRARPMPRAAACAQAMGAPRDAAGARWGAQRRLPPPPPRRSCAARAAAAPGLGIPVTAEPIRAPCWPVSARRRPGTERCGGESAALPREPAVASPRPMGIESFCSADAYEPFWVSGGMGPRGLGSAAAAGVGAEGWRRAGWDEGGRGPSAPRGCARRRGARACRAGVRLGQSAGGGGAARPGRAPALLAAAACVREHRHRAAAGWVAGQGRGRGLAGLRVGAMSPRPGRRAGAGVPRVRVFRQGSAWRGNWWVSACLGGWKRVP